MLHPPDCMCMPAGPATATILAFEPPLLERESVTPAQPLEAGALQWPGQSAPATALRAGEVPTLWGRLDTPGACKQLYAAAAQHAVDPFGVLKLPNLWPVSSRSSVRPRPLPVGPAYNSSKFEIFLKSSYVSLVRHQHTQGYAGPLCAACPRQGPCRLFQHMQCICA